MAAPLKFPAEVAAIQLPEQIRLDLRTSIGQIRQLRWSIGSINTPVASFITGRIPDGSTPEGSGGERVLLVEK